MQNKFIPFTHNNQPCMLQLSMRPIQLYEVVYPEAAHDAVMKIIQPNADVDYTHDPKNGSKNKKFPNRVRFGLKWLRKLLGLDETKLPADLVVDVSQSFYRQALGVHIVGSKKDTIEEIKVNNIDAKNEMI